MAPSSGTRSDLENETLRIEVYDWDYGSSADLMGWAEVPLRGVLLSGHIEASLVMFDREAERRDKERARAVPQASKGAGEAASKLPPSRLKPAGQIEGSIVLVSEPEHTQFGDVVKRLKTMTYLAVQIVRCTNLPQMKPDGTCDPYVSVVWAATSQQTRVIRSTLSPQYDETLYFPTNLSRISSEDLAAKGDIVVYVLHHNPVAPDDIGFVRIPLSKITASQVHRIEDGTGGAILRTRVLDESPMNLKQQGMGESRGEIKIKVSASDDPSGCLG